jgi:hypothetical protein
MPLHDARSDETMQAFEHYLVDTQAGRPDLQTEIRKVIKYLQVNMYDINEFRAMKREDLVEMAATGIAKNMVFQAQTL